MPFLERSQNTTVNNGTFVDQSHNDQRTYINYTRPPASGGGDGFDKLQHAAIRQAIHDSSECATLKPACFPGTREEHTRNITSWGKGEWESTESARVLWLHGPAGVGKSALAQSCTQNIGVNIVAATFFFSRLNQWNHSGALIPTICYQLATRSQDYRNLVTDIITHDPFVLEKSIPNQFKELVVNPLAKLRAHDQSIFASHLIVIDGLDEADRDIRLYLEDAFRTIRAKYDFPTSMTWPPEKAIDQLVDQSAGLFAYTSSAIRYISGDGMNLPSLDERLNAVLDLGKTRAPGSDNPFSHLDTLYLLVMIQIPPSVLPNTLALLCLRIEGAPGAEQKALFYSSILRLSLADFYTSVNNLYSVLAVSKSITDMPLRLSFYHASFGEFLQDVKRSTPKFHIGATEVYQRCIAASAETLNRLSRYNDASELDAALSWPPSPDMYPTWDQSHGHDLFVLATSYLFRFPEFIGLDKSIPAHLSSVNWKFAISDGAYPVNASALFQHIPKEWRPKIIRCPHRSPSQFLHQVLSDLIGGKKLTVVGRKRYVLGSGENRVWLEPYDDRGYDIKEYS
ncbi:hypothetical protein AN958_12618 [Leucoagaricus sp. SymC.cos]|nr:hypothetical protein AN958_12618 [Leucoagaricus sp. SymC.cos]